MASSLFTIGCNMASETNFACQRCCQPLKIHASFDDLDEKSRRELICLIKHDQDVSPDVVCKAITVPKLSDSETNDNSGFLVIGDQNSSTKNSSNSRDHHDLNYSITVKSRLFDILNDQSSVKHPLCEDCADFVSDQMGIELQKKEEECRELREYLNDLQKKCSPEENAKEEERIKELESQCKELEGEESDILRQLEEVDQQQKQAEAMVTQQQKELEELNAEDTKYWLEYNNLKRTFFECEDELQSVSNQLKYSMGQLEKLKRTNVFNLTFHIWSGKSIVRKIYNNFFTNRHAGHFGTINGFRLGRLPTTPVKWSEINAAWGQAALLLHSLAKKMNLTFQRYRIVPYGSQSFLESLEDKSKQLPLFLWNGKFDAAMVAFLDCLQQLNDEICRVDSGFVLPYKMDKGRIEDTRNGTSYSVKIQFNSEEDWTKGLKYMLTNLKWILVWVSNQDG